MICATPNVDDTAPVRLHTIQAKAQCKSFSSGHFLPNRVSEDLRSVSEVMVGFRSNVQLGQTPHGLHFPLPPHGHFT